MLLLMLILCLWVKSEIFTLVCVSISLLRFLYRIAEENPHNDL